MTVLAQECRECWAHFEQVAPKPRTENAPMTNFATTGQLFHIKQQETAFGRISESTACSRTSKQVFNDFSLQHRSISRHHACLVFRGERWLLFDCKSANGVFVNGDKIVNEVELKTDDTVRFGPEECTFVFRNFLLAKRKETSVKISEKQLNAFKDFFLNVSCAVCKTLLFHPLITNCGHLICCECFARWFKEDSKQCISCKKEITQFFHATIVEKLIQFHILPFLSKQNKETYLARNQSLIFLPERFQKAEITNSVPNAIQSCDWIKSDEQTERLRLFYSTLITLTKEQDSQNSNNSEKSEQNDEEISHRLFLSVKENWSPKQKETFVSGLEQYSYGPARKLYFSIIGIDSESYFDCISPEDVKTAAGNFGLLDNSSATIQAEIKRMRKSLKSFYNFGHEDVYCEMVNGVFDNDI